MNDELGRVWTDTVVVKFKVKSRHYVERLTRTSRNLSGQSVSGLRFYPGTSQIGGTIVNHPDATFGL